MGFSAGGEVAALIGTRFDAGNDSATDAIERASSRPDFAIVVYPGFRPGTGSGCSTGSKVFIRKPFFCFISTISAGSWRNRSKCSRPNEPGHHQGILSGWQTSVGNLSWTVDAD